MKPGIYQNMSNEEYHATDALGSTGLKELAKSPAHYKAWKEDGAKTSKALEIGHATHLLILEPDLFDKEVCIYNGIKRGKKWDAFLSTNQGKTILKPHEYDTLVGMNDAIWNNETASGLLTIEGPVEQSVFWEDQHYGFQCKCRPDKTIPAIGILADLKSCQDASPEGFSRACGKFGYHIQAAHYLEGMNTAQGAVSYQTFVFIAVEKAQPFSVGVYRADYNFIDAGRETIYPLLQRYAGCLEGDVWPGFDDKIVDLSLPNWA